jgi:hypothetical protein
VGIFFNPNSYDESKRLIYHSYIALAYSAFDDFLDKFKSDLKSIYGEQSIVKKKDGEKGIDHINRCVKNIKPNSIHRNSFDLEYFLINHYRIIRNEFIHPMIKKNEPYSCIYNTKYEALYLKKYPKFPELAYREKNSIEFADFIVLSKAILDYAKYITIFAEPDNDYYEALIDIKKHSKYNIHSERFINSIAQFFVTKYNLNPDKAKEIAYHHREKVLKSNG